MVKAKDIAFVLVDYQGRLAAAMEDNIALNKKMVQLVNGMQILDIEVIWLEQYPQGLGSTVEEVKVLLEGNNQPMAKNEFSGFRNKSIHSELGEVNKENIVVAGIEAHVCVYQLVKDLLKQGKKVEYVVDAIASRSNVDKEVAMNKMNQLGAHPTSVEMLLFELLETALHPKFKEIGKLIK